jgi:hypothetical protein
MCTKTKSCVQEVLEINCSCYVVLERDQWIFTFLIAVCEVVAVRYDG